MISTAALVEKFQQALNEDWGYIWGTAGIMWSAAEQQKKVNYMVSKYGANWKNSAAAKEDTYYSAAANGGKWIGHMVADCSGLFVWAFRQLGGSIYHGSNTIWNKYCTAKGELKNGKRTDGQELKPGTAIFTHNTKNDNRGHIGLYIGGGWVIEASGTINGVIKSRITISKWVEWGELKGVYYGENIPADNTVKVDEGSLGTIRKGDKGPTVKYAQQLLKDRGYDLGRYGVDGDFGSATQAAVKAFQRDWGLTVDGVIGPKTWAMLKSTPDKKPEVKYRVTISGLTETQKDALVSQYENVKVEKEGA